MSRSRLLDESRLLDWPDDGFDEEGLSRLDDGLLVMRYSYGLDDTIAARGAVEVSLLPLLRRRAVRRVPNPL